MDLKIPEMASKFLDNIGWEGCSIIPLTGDASFRRYFRVFHRDGVRMALLMDAPPPHEDPKPFIHIAEYLTGNNFRAPNILGQDLEHGLVLIEDFGDQRMREHLDEKPEDEIYIYKQAIDIIIKLSNYTPVAVKNYDESEYIREISLLAQWYMPAVSLEVDEEAYISLWKKVLRPLYAAKPVTVLRDYHAENIMLLSDGDMGIIDFQDALVGHQAYDLVSLLQDARRDVSAKLEQEMLDYYRRQTTVDDDFLAHYAILGAQRNAKIIGIFARLCFRDGKHKYLGYLHRMWGLLERDLEHPSLKHIKLWFDENIPHHIRYGEIKVPA